LLVFDPLEKCGFVDENPTTSPLDYAVKAVGLGMEDEVTEAALGRPLVVVIPARNGDETLLDIGHKKTS